MQDKAIAALRQQQYHLETVAKQKITLEARIATLEDTIATQERSNANLRDSLNKSEYETRAELQSLSSEVQDKNMQLADAERRFQELEKLLQRIMARSSSH